MLIKIEAIINEEKFEEVKDALNEIRTATKIRTNETAEYAIWADVQKKRHEEAQQQQ